MLGAAGILGVLTLMGATGPWTLLFLTFALGLGATMNGPAWQATVPDLAPKGELPAAIALNSVGFNMARAVGPALGGLLVAATNPGIAFLLNAFSFVGVILVLYRWKRPVVKNIASEERVVSAMVAGLRYIRYSPPIHAVLVRSGVFVLAASALWSILPVVARQELHSGSTGYGVLLGCLGAGSILGAVLLARLRAHVSTDALVTAGSLLFGAVNLALAWLTPVAIVGVVLFVGGIAWMTVMSSFTIATQPPCRPGCVPARSPLMFWRSREAWRSAAWFGEASPPVVASVLRFSPRESRFPSVA